MKINVVLIAFLVGQIMAVPVRRQSEEGSGAVNGMFPGPSSYSFPPAGVMYPQNFPDSMSGYFSGPMDGQFEGSFQGPMDGSFEGPMGGPFQGPMDGPFQGPMDGPFPGPMDGPFQGPMGGPFPGPMDRPFPGPMDRPFPGPMDGNFPGPMNGNFPGPMNGPFPGPMDRPFQGPMNRPFEGPMNGPFQGPMGGGFPGFMGGSFPGPMGGGFPGPMDGGFPGPHYDEYDEYDEYEDDDNVHITATFKVGMEDIVKSMHHPFEDEERPFADSRLPPPPPPAFRPQDMAEDRPQFDDAKFPFAEDKPEFMPGNKSDNSTRVKRGAPDGKHDDEFDMFEDHDMDGGSIDIKAEFDIGMDDLTNIIHAQFVHALMEEHREKFEGEIHPAHKPHDMEEGRKPAGDDLDQPAKPEDNENDKPSEE